MSDVHLTEASSATAACYVRVEFDPPPIPVRQYDWHAWIEGDEEWGTFHAPTEKEALVALCEALVERCYSRPSTTGCAQCGRVVEVS